LFLFVNTYLVELIKIPQLHAAYFTPPVVKHLLAFPQVLLRPGQPLQLSASPLLPEFYRHIAFNSALWARVSSEVMILQQFKLNNS
jgi:hypothetical protein